MGKCLYMTGLRMLYLFKFSLLNNVIIRYWIFRIGVNTSKTSQRRLIWFLCSSAGNNLLLTAWTKVCKLHSKLCQIMFYDLNVLALLTFAVSATAQLSTQEKADDKSSRLESEVLCSEAGNCTCLIKKSYVTVKCTSVGDKLDEIVSELPKTTTYL